MDVGFIGLGAMGNPMAMNLLKAGHRLSVYARRPEAAASLVAAGAQACASPRALAAQSEVVFTIVTDTKAVHEVLLGAEGVVEGARAGTVVIDMSTISPTATKQMAQTLAQRGVEMLDAPVSGGEVGAREATLSIMAGGKAQVLERVRPLLECLGKTIVHIGDSGAGQIAKACNQICLLITQQGVMEAILLAKAAGADPARVREALLGGYAASRMLDVQGKKMVERDFGGKIEARLHHKDLGIALELAQQLGIGLPSSALAGQQFNALMGAGGAKLDSAAVITVLERMAQR